MLDNSKLAKVRKLLPKTDGHSLELGRLYLAAKRQGSLNEFCREVPTHYRMAYYLAEIADAVDNGWFRESDLKDLGWTKAQHILHVCKTKSQIRKAVAFARRDRPSLSALRAQLSGGGKGKKVSMVFRLEADDLRLLQAALVANGAHGTSRRMVNREAALMKIVRRATPAPGLRRAA